MSTITNPCIGKLVLLIMFLLGSPMSFAQNTQINCPVVLTINGFAPSFTGINDAGAVVGVMLFPRGIQNAFVMYGGREWDFNFPRTENDTVPNDINKNSQIVGGYSDASGRGHGFVVLNGAFKAIDFPGAKSSQRDQQSRRYCRKL